MEWTVITGVVETAAALDEIPASWPTIANSQGFAEGIASFTEKRPSLFKGK